MSLATRWDGKQITKAGLYAGVPMKAYHSADITAGNSISSTGLRRLWSEGPAYFWDRYAGNPDRDPDDKSTEAQAMGRATHHLICGEAYFAAEYKCRPEELPNYKTGELRPWHGNHVECKKWLEEQARAGLTVLTIPQVERIKGMGKALSRDEDVIKGALNGLIEHSMFWQDDVTGIWCKARPDFWPVDSGHFIDLKTTSSVRWLDLRRTLCDYDYHMQAALVLEGANKLGLEAEKFSNAWVESERPFCTRLTTFIDEDIVRGIDQNRAMLDLMAQCLKDNVWPGPGDFREDAENIQLPDWKRKQIDDRLKLHLREAA